MRRLLVLCAVAGVIFAAYAVAQDGSTGSPSGSSASAGLPANARVIATGVAVRALAPDSAAPEFGGHLYFTFATAPDIVAALQTSGMQRVSLSGVRADTLAATSKSLRLVEPVAGTGQAGSLGDGGAATSAQLDLAADSLVKRSGIAVAPDGTIFVADTQNSTIRSVSGVSSSEPGVIRSVAGRWAARQNIALAQPMGIAVDRAGNLYIADHSAGAVDVLSAATGQLATLAHVISPASIAVMPDGSEVFVASPETGGVFEIATNSRSITAVTGFAPVSDSAATSGPCAGVGSTSAQSAAASQQVCPAGLAVDSRGDLFVADASGGKISRVDAKSGKSSAIASGLSVPGEIALDAKGNLYVAEQGAMRVLVLPEVTGNSGNITLTAPAAFASPCPQTITPFTYCNMPNGGTSPTAAFTLRNTSASASVTAVAISVTTTDFTIESKSCTVTLAASSSCLINVAFTPQGSGARSGTLTVTDSSSGDSATYDLAGMGDDYSLALASGQPQEVSVAQGGTATFKAMVTPDSVFGQNGEKVMFQCPSNVPLFTSCAISPCPAAITPGAAVAFSVVFVTSSKTSTAPSVTPCSGGSGVGPGVRPQNPTMILRVAPQLATAARHHRFPALWWLGLVALGILGGAALVRIRGGLARMSVSVDAGSTPGQARAADGGSPSAALRTIPHSTWLLAILRGAALRGVRDRSRSLIWPVLRRQTGCITPSIFAGHDISCPYEFSLAGDRGEWGVSRQASSAGVARHGGLRSYEKRARVANGAAGRVRFGFALAGVAVLILLGCGGKKSSSTTSSGTSNVTPVAVTTMTILGNATDASGNSLGTSRSLQIILDVVKQ